MRPIDADALKDNMFHYAAPEMVWDRGDIEHKINEMPTIDAIPVEWLEYMQRESLSENDRTMVGAIEAIFIEWHIYVNRLREMNRQKEQEAR